jgi:hypothetical protein
MSDDKLKISPDIAVSHGRAETPDLTGAHSYLPTPAIRPSSSSTGQSTSQAKPVSTEKK